MVIALEILLGAVGYYLIAVDNWTLAVAMIMIEWSINLRSSRLFGGKEDGNI